MARIEMRPGIGPDGQPVYYAIEPFEPPTEEDADLEPATFAPDAPAPSVPRLAVLLLAGAAFVLAMSGKK